MSRLENAQKRLVDALARLENAAIRPQGDQSPEMKTLRASLSEAQKENEALRETTQSVAGRLDETIKRLNAILAE